MKKLSRRLALHRETVQILASRRLREPAAAALLSDYSCEGTCVTCTECVSNCKWC